MEIGMNRMDIMKKRWRLITGILGFIVLMLMGRLVGDLGLAYLALSLECLVLLRLLFIEAVPDCMERLIRSRMAKGQYKNADKVFVAAVGYGAACGMIGTLLLFFLSGLFFRLLHVPEASLALRILAPAFFLCAAGAVLKGYFQGMGTAVPAMIADVMQRIFTLVFAALFGHSAYTYGEKAAALLHNDDFAAMYGTAGIAGGYLLATLLAVCFLLLVYIGAGRRIRKKAREGMRLTEDAIEVFRLLLWSMAPVALIRFFCRAGILAGYGIYQTQQKEATDVLQSFGAFYGKFLPIAGIVILLALLICVKSEQTIIHIIKKEEYKNAKNYVTGGIQSIFFFTGFVSMLLFVLAPCFMKLLFGEEGTFVAACMQRGFPLLILFPLGIFFIHILEGTGRKKTAVLLSAIAFFGSLLVMFIAAKKTMGSVYAFVYALEGFSALLCIAAGIFVFKSLRSGIDWLHVFLFPALTVFITGLCLFMLNKALVTMTGELFTVILCTVAGGICYLILLLVFRCITEKDLYVMPGGGWIRKVGAFFHLF